MTKKKAKPPNNNTFALPPGSTKEYANPERPALFNNWARERGILIREHNFTEEEIKDVAESIKAVCQNTNEPRNSIASIERGVKAMIKNYKTKKADGGYKLEQDVSIVDDEKKTEDTKSKGGNIVKVLQYIKDNIDAEASEIYLHFAESGIDVHIETIRTLLAASRNKSRGDFMDGITPVKIEDEQDIITWKGFSGNEEPIVLATRENHILVQGKKKSRKSLLLFVFLKLVASKLKIGYFDTEQGNNRVMRLLLRLAKYTGRLIGKNLFVYNLRKKSPGERKRIIMKLTGEHKFDVIVIDGIRDLVADFNSVGETSDLIYWLENLIGISSAQVINVLHQNKGALDYNSRGHLGSELENKCENVFSTETDPATGTTLVTNPFPREIAMAPFGLRHDLNQLPELCPAPTITKGNGAKSKVKAAATYETVKTVVAKHFSGKKAPTTHTELLHTIVDECKRSEASAKSDIKKLVDDGILIKTGESKRTKYNYAGK